VNAALLPPDSALAAVLREREDWKIVYSDRIATLFVNTTGEPVLGSVALPLRSGIQKSVELSASLAEP
jgi:hypothetical protein